MTFKLASDYIDVAANGCSIAGCHRAHEARGWCNTHYERWRLHGSTDDRPNTRTDPVVRFAAMWTLDPETGCHLWKASVDTNGYGAFRVDGKLLKSHRFAYEQEFGSIPEGKELDHFRCETKACCNPYHVRPVTSRENGYRGNNACSVNLAKTHCPQGHPYDAANTWLTHRGFRICKTCSGDRQRRYRASKKAAA